MTLELITKETPTPTYYDSFITLFEGYFKEVHGDDYIGSKQTIETLLIHSLMNNKSLYVLLDKQHEPIGFMLVYLNDQYGNTTTTVVCDYMYVSPKHRSSRAIAKLYSMMGDIMEDYNCDGIGTTFVTSSNKGNNKIVGGEVIAEITHVRLDKSRAYNKRLKRHT